MTLLFISPIRITVGVRDHFSPPIPPLYSFKLLEIPTHARGLQICLSATIVGVYGGGSGVWVWGRTRGGFITHIWLCWELGAGR